MIHEKGREKMREVAWFFEIHMNSVEWQKVMLHVNDFVHWIPTHRKLNPNWISGDVETIEKKKKYTKETLSAAPSDTT